MLKGLDKNFVWVYTSYMKSTTQESPVEEIQKYIEGLKKMMAIANGEYLAELQDDLEAAELELAREMQMELEL